MSPIIFQLPDEAKMSSPRQDDSFPGTRRQNQNRNLEDYESYLVDGNGNPYEPYSLSWRYLGMYIDCDIQDQQYVNYDESNLYRRLTNKLFSSTITTRDTKSNQKRSLGESGDDNDDCSRKVLWAAYHDPSYRGNSIGEYQFYDRMEGLWNTDTCQPPSTTSILSRGCKKMDCHTSSSKHFKLVGVFKETDGLVDFVEQLFKHEGYCVWDGDKYDEEGGGSADGDDDGSSNYEFMYNRQDYIPQDCSQMYLTDDYGNTVYRGVTPLEGGNMTESLYIDEDCTQRSPMSFEAYIVKWYSYYYYSQETGQQVAQQWAENTQRWNELMMDFQICQPCRAYNKVPTYEDEDHRRQRQRRRHLEDNDGEGDEEQYGYNCYDDAGYRNCNQCYKFETHTDMEPASLQDLQRASNQGTILAIKIDGVTYGKGGIDWYEIEPQAQAALWALSFLSMIAIVILINRYYGDSILDWWGRLRNRRFQKSLREGFIDDSSNGTESDESWSSDMEEELVRNRKIIEEQEREIEQLKLEMKQKKILQVTPEESSCLSGKKVEKKDDGGESS